MSNISIQNSCLDFEEYDDDYDYFEDGTFQG